MAPVIIVRAIIFHDRPNENCQNQSGYGKKLDDFGERGIITTAESEDSQKESSGSHINKIPPSFEYAERAPLFSAGAPVTCRLDHR